MTKDDYTKPSSEVEGNVYEEFLKRLAESKVQPIVIQRLRALLFSDKGLTEKSIADALLSEDHLP